MCNSGMAKSKRGRPADPDFTRKQNLIVACLGAGISSKEIARKLGLKSRQAINRYLPKAVNACRHCRRPFNHGMRFRCGQLGDVKVESVSKHGRIRNGLI